VDLIITRDEQRHVWTPCSQVHGHDIRWRTENTDGTRVQHCFPSFESLYMRVRL